MSVAAAQMLADDYESYGIGADPVDWLDTGTSSSLTEDDSVFNVFVPIVNNLSTQTLTLNIQGNGTVSSNPDKVQFSYGEEVTLTATADPGWVFAGWSGDLAGSTNPEILTMNGDKTVTATFTEITHILTVSMVGNGAVTLNPDKAQYSDGEVVTLTATADPGWLFSGWSGNLTGSVNPETLTMNGDKTVTATFTEISHTLTVSTVGNGTVTLNPDKTQYSDGEVVTLTATADPGWVFAGWSGDLSGSTNPETLTMNGDKTVTATFTEITHNLTLSMVGNGTVALNPDKTQYSGGEIVTLTATADPGWLFSGWSGNLTGSVNPETLTMNGDKTVTATFTEITHNLTLSMVGNGTVALNPDKTQYSDGEVVTLTATADPGWLFSGWSGNLTGSINPETLTMNGDKTVTATFDIDPDPSYPIIDIWYGPEQDFGQLGVPQKWVNILGNVTDPDGIDTLTYSLNGEIDSALSIGPDTRRLADTGDFNVEIDYNDLLNGSNSVLIKATDNLGLLSTETVTVNYTGGNVWPLPYSVDWDTVTNIQDVAQIVDGKWGLVPGGVRTTQVDYDRVLDIGDLIWSDYEVTMPITVHAIDPDGYLWPSNNPGFGLTMKWGGHTDNPVVCGQPHCGWLPSGAGGWYSYRQEGDRFTLDGVEDPSVTIGMGDTFYWKMRVETIPGIGPLYSLKVWEAGQPEPAGWNITKQRGLGDVLNGSPVIVAHHVDLTVGDVSIVPLVP